MPEKEFKSIEEVDIRRKEQLISLGKKCAKLLKSKYKVNRVVSYRFTCKRVCDVHDRTPDFISLIS